MGRTRRLRKRLTKAMNLSHCQYVIFLMKWMKSNGWKPTIKMKVADFALTGRGFKAYQHINPEEILVNIPKTFLISTKTVLNSEIGKIFQNRKPITGQAVIAFYLVYLLHVQDSFWNPYLKSLPRNFTIPFFVQSGLPEFLEKLVNEQKEIINYCFEFVKNLIENEICLHCNTPLTIHFSLSDFIWAWFVVTSRSVFYEHSDTYFHQDNLALAPFLDLFNHSESADIEAYVDEYENYIIKTYKPTKKYDQIFINYGQLTNIKLCLNYGFILNNNPHDSISFTMEEILQLDNTIFLSESKKAFIFSHNFICQNLFITSEGLSYHSDCLLYLCITCESQFIKKVFALDYCKDDQDKINHLSILLINKKKNEYQNLWNTYCNKETSSENLNVVGALLKEYIALLDKALIIQKKS